MINYRKTDYSILKIEIEMLFIALKNIFLHKIHDLYQSILGRSLRKNQRASRNERSY